jgi:hypothetical protein
MIAILTSSQHFKAPVSLPLVHRRTTNWKLLWICLFCAHRGVLLFFSTEWRWSFFYHYPCSAATNWGHFNGLSWTMAKSGIARRWFTLSRVIVVEQNSQLGCWLLPGSCVRCRPENGNIEVFRGLLSFLPKVWLVSSCRSQLLLPDTFLFIICCHSGIRYCLAIVAGKDGYFKH